jgi:hypothetical protein
MYSVVVYDAINACQMRKERGINVRNVILLATTIVVGILHTPAVAESGSCDAILALGTRNLMHSELRQSAASVLYSRDCGKNWNNESDETAVAASVEIFGGGRGDGKVDVKKTKEQLNEWCREHKDERSASIQQMSDASQIFEPSIRAWSLCKKWNSGGIQVSPVISDDALDVNITYTGGGTSGPAFYGIDAVGFICRTRALATFRRKNRHGSTAPENGQAAAG